MTLESKLLNLRYTINGDYLCNAAIKTIYRYDDDRLLYTNFTIKVHQEDHYIDISHIKSGAMGFEVTCFEEGGYRFHITDFILPVEVRQKGVARNIWHHIYQRLPDEHRDNTKISGSLSLIDTEGSHATTRDQLWQDLIGYEKDNKAVYKLSDDGNGYFKGCLHDPWDAEKSRLEIETLEELLGRTSTE